MDVKVLTTSTVAAVQPIEQSGDTGIVALGDTTVNFSVDLIVQSSSIARGCCCSSGIVAIAKVDLPVACPQYCATEADRSTWNLARPQPYLVPWQVIVVVTTIVMATATRDEMVFFSRS